MSRIRSIHPRLFTDEAFAGVSIAARMLSVGILTECFDDGVFEWKPVTLKMRLFPADSVEISQLLSELEQANIIKQFSSNGKSYGLVRNFCKFQRPKKPNSSGVLPEELHGYVAFGYKRPDQSSELDQLEDTPSSEPVPNSTHLKAPPVPNQYGTRRSEGRKGGRKEGKLSSNEDNRPSEETPLSIFRECLSDETAKALVEHRKALKAAGTANAARLLVDEFKKHGNPELCAKTMMVRSWKGFDANWMRDSRMASSGNGYAQILTELPEFQDEQPRQSQNLIENVSSLPISQNRPDGSQNSDFDISGNPVGSLIRNAIRSM